MCSASGFVRVSVDEGGNEEVHEGGTSQPREARTFEINSKIQKKF